VPALVVALLFRMIDAFRVFDLVFVLTQGGPADGTLVLQYYGYKRMFVEGQMGLGAAVAVLVFAMVAAMAAVTLRVAGVRSRREAAP
jgi:multiple sugar transport system permease protein